MQGLLNLLRTRRVSTRLVLQIVQVGVAVQVALFSYFFYVQRSPVRIVGTRLPAVAPSAPTYAYSIYGDWGAPMAKPMDVAVVGTRIYVSDTNNGRVQVFDYSGNPLFRFGQSGTGEGQFQFPYGIDDDPQGRIFVADMYNATIQIFAPDGHFLAYFEPGKPGAGILVKPAGLRIVGDRVYVTDVAKCRVLVFNLQGELQLEFGTTGQGPGQLLSPNSLTIAGDRVYVSDTGNHKVEVFTLAGEPVLNFDGMPGTDQSLVVNPRGVGVDGRGVVYVVSNLTSRVEGFDSDGKNLFQFGGPGTGEGQMALPNGLDVDEQGRIYVTDTVNGRVVVYQN